MAKQTFTTGQVLTASQMTSLQQTAMLGGAASAKTASYTLVAADAGTAISMSNASATTITVNTGLFAAGDTVFIQNIGAGACTITAGTATVASAGSLILPQNDAGILYFTSTGAATFYDFIQAGAVSPLTTKGDVYTFSTSDARLGVGANNTVLTADSAQATGLKWAAVAGGAGNLVEIATGTLSGASLTISSLSSYTELLFLVTGCTNSTADGNVYFRINNNSGANYSVFGGDNTGTVFEARRQTGNTQQRFLNNSINRTSVQQAYGARLFNCKNAGFTSYDTNAAGELNSTSIGFSNYKGVYTVAEAVSSFVFANTGGNWAGGTYYLYGG